MSIVSDAAGAEKSWHAYNDFLALGSLDRYSKILARYELFRRVVDLPGDIIEAGVFKGTGVLYWAKLLAIFNPLSLRRVVGFDTFQGFLANDERATDVAAGAGLEREAAYQPVSPDDILRVAEMQNLDRRIELVAGDATVTIPEYTRRHPGFRIALLNLDFDVYRPTKVALEELYDRVVPGGVIAFDEYAARPWGESDAVDEFFQSRGVRYRTLPWALSPTAYVIKGDRGFRRRIRAS